MAAHPYTRAMAKILEDVHWGIIGCGNVCEVKAGPALAGVEHASLVAVMRRDGDKAADFAARHGVPRWYDDVDALLADDAVDCVYVATPDAAHAELTIRAAEAGKHVLVEKAMATNADDCTKMIEACKKAGVVLAVAYYRRGYPTILRAKRLIDDGAIGTLREVHLNDESPLSHRLDLMHLFMGDAAAVRAEHGPLPPCAHAPEGLTLLVEHAGGGVGVTPAGWDENLVAETLDLRGDRGRILILDLKAGHLVLHRDGGDKQTEQLGPLPATHWGLVDNFVKHIRGEAPLACDGHEGRKSTVILDIVAALGDAAGGPIAVDYGA